jgi:hypothetical protein
LGLGLRRSERDLRPALQRTLEHVFEGVYMTDEKIMLEPKQRKLLKEMFECMKEMLTDDILERYIPGETTERDAAIKMWERDVEIFVSLCKQFHFAVNEATILKTGRLWLKKHHRREVRK